MLFSIVCLVFIFIVSSDAAAQSDSSAIESNPPVDPTKVIIVMSSGTSGSTELCGIVSNIIKGDDSFGPELYELLGGGFESMSKETNPLGTVLEYLSKEQRHHPGVFAGFKYKNYYHDENYEKLLNWIATERVKVIYNTRNPLDVYIGTLKSHQPGGKHNCNDEGKHVQKCIEKQQAITLKVPLDEVLEELKSRETRNVEWYERLKITNVDFMHVTYEKINNGTRKERVVYVQTIADFFKPGFEVTPKTLDVSTEFIGHTHQSDIVENYDELKEKLKGTRFERYLH